MRAGRHGRPGVATDDDDFADIGSRERAGRRGKIGSIAGSIRSALPVCPQRFGACVREWNQTGKHPYRDLRSRVFRDHMHHT